jgi:hypothetical protein
MGSMIDKGAAFKKALDAVFNVMVDDVRGTIEDPPSVAEKLPSCRETKSWLEKEGRRDDAEYIGHMIDYFGDYRDDHKEMAARRMLDWLVSHEKYESCDYVKSLVDRHSKKEINIDAKIID